MQPALSLDGGKGSQAKLARNQLSWRLIDDLLVKPETPGSTPLNGVSRL
jgi:hypothetical protein